MILGPSSAGDYYHGQPGQGQGQQQKPSMVLGMYEQQPVPPVGGVMLQQQQQHSAGLPIPRQAMMNNSSSSCSTAPKAKVAKHVHWGVEEKENVVVTTYFPGQNKAPHPANSCFGQPPSGSSWQASGKVPGLMQQQPGLQLQQSYTNTTTTPLGAAAYTAGVGRSEHAPYGALAPPKPVQEQQQSRSFFGFGR